MKKPVKFIIMSLIILTLVGCKSTDENDAKQWAGKFIANLHTVDRGKVAEYEKLKELTPPGVGLIGEEVPGEVVTGPNREYTKILESLDKNIRDLMTSEAYEKLLKNRFNLASTDYCSRNNCNSQVINVVLGEDLYKDYEDVDKLRYAYQANIEFNPNSGQAAYEDQVGGYIELLKEESEWKVSLYTISSYPSKR